MTRVGSPEKQLPTCKEKINKNNSIRILLELEGFFRKHPRNNLKLKKLACAGTAGPVKIM
jgi:hypothetical protein